MDYNEFLEEIKTIIMAKLKDIVPEDAYDANPMLSKDLYLDVIYSDIMALGYNFGDIKKAADDIFECKSWAVHPDKLESFYEGIVRDIRETAANYPSLVEAFSKSHRAKKSGTGFAKIIADVETDLGK